MSGSPTLEDLGMEMYFGIRTSEVPPKAAILSNSD